MKTKLIILGLAIILGFYIGWRLHDKTRFSYPKPSYGVIGSYPVKVTTDNPAVDMKVKPVEIKTINKRGDKQIVPIKGTVVVDSTITNFTIEVPGIIENKLNKWKITGYARYHDQSVQPGIGVLYEPYNFGDYNINLGMGVYGLIFGWGKTLTQSSEIYLGVSISNEKPAPVFGVAVRF